MVSSDTRSVSELERRVEAFDATGPGEMDADDRARLTDALVALADAYGDRGEFDAEAEMIARLDRLYQAGEDGDADIHLANALANAASVRGREAVYQTAIDPDRLEEYRERIESLYGRRTEPAIAAPLARATAETIHANGKSDRRGRITPLLERIEEVYAAHPEPDIAASVLRAHAHAELYLDDEPERDDTADGSPTERDDAADGSQTERDDAADGSQTERDDAADGSQTERDAGRDRVVRAEELFGDHPDGEVAAGLAGVLAGRTNADAKRTDVAAIEERIARIEALADQYPGQAESVRRWLPVATANGTRASFEAADPGRVEHWASVTVDHHERLSTPSSATWAAVATFFAARASFFDGDVEAGETELERLEALERQYDSPVFAHWLGRAMFDAARSYVETDHPERAKAMVDELSEFAVGHEDREEIEAGLEALRTHAPDLFDEVEHAVDADTGGRADEPPAETGTETSRGDAASGMEDPLDAPHAHGDDSTAAATSTDATTSAAATSTDATTSADATSADATAPTASPEADPAADEADEADADLPGCGNCGEDGCGNCGTGTDLKPPASGPVVAAAGAAVLLVGISVVYTLYRAQHALRNALAGS